MIVLIISAICCVHIVQKQMSNPFFGYERDEYELCL